eukprot:944082-Amorphochlora_amoeboformis.AAC.1
MRERRLMKGAVSAFLTNMWTYDIFTQIHNDIERQKGKESQQTREREGIEMKEKRRKERERAREKREREEVKREKRGKREEIVREEGDRRRIRDSYDRNSLSLAHTEKR